MEKVLDKYGISRDLPRDQKLAALEKQKLKVLRKLNHVFGNPEKEVRLNEELEALERTMHILEESGGKLSLDDIVYESRELTQTEVTPGDYEKISVEEKEKRIAAGEEEPEEIIELIYQVLAHYLRERFFEKYEYWLLAGARMGDGYCMRLLYSYYTNDVYGVKDEKRAFYWLEQGAKLGDKDCLEQMGIYYANQDSKNYNPAKAVSCFVKAADSEHPDSYIFASHMFQKLGDYQKAEICLKAAEQIIGK